MISAQPNILITLQYSQTTILTYLSGPGGLYALHLINHDGSENIHYIHTDHLGSWTKVTNEDGKQVDEQSYDAWGNRRNPSTWQTTGSWQMPRYDRGFTGHEHLDGFQLINMNGRMYDPVVSRMLAPDNFVQTPDFSQNFNRYSYALNNPLMFTDPSGELFGWDDAIVGGIGFAFGYVSYGLSNGDWGWNAVGAGAIGAGTALLGYYSGGATSAASIAEGFASSGIAGVGNNYAATVALGYSGRYVASAAISSVMPSISIPVGDNFNVNVSTGVGFGSGGLVGGVNISGTYHDGTTVISGGYGVAGNSSSWSIGAMHNGYGGSYYRTSYSGSMSQVVGGVGLNFNKVSVRLENDFFGDGHDRWRSSALEIGIGDFVFGTNLLNNDPAGENQDIVNLPDRRGNYNTDGYGAWRNGKVYNSPWYAGYRSGNNVTRWGYSHPSAQDLTQNNVHRLVPFGRQNYYVDYSEFTSGSYMYSGFYNPYSLW
ncbi:MAG: polymorphic toxin type 23 domain-containing protein [Bacteroidales bacterium]|nr:polymorphic toxin type 23 domain-containing protein [Bacteroidales bacterium]